MATQYLPATIQVNSRVATLINVFTIDPENQQALLDLLKLQTDSLISLVRRSKIVPRFDEYESI